MKNLKVYLFIGFFLLILIIISQCGSNRQTILIDTRAGSTAEKVTDHVSDSTKIINLYMDASIGMKGYFDNVNVSDSAFLLKSLLPTLIVDLIDRGYKMQTHTVHKETNEIPVSNFLAGLKSKSLFYGGNDLKKYLPDIVRSANESVKIIVSDFIYDNVKVDNVTILRDVRNEIYESLKESDKAILLMQFYSDFNADHYYNMNTSEKPFFRQDITLKKRPFYIMVIGDYQKIEALIDYHIFKNYENVFVYAEAINILNEWSLIKSYKKGSVAIRENDNELIVYKPEKSKPFSFLIGYNFIELPIGFNSIEYLNANSQLKQDYLRDNIKWKWIDKNNFINNYIDKKDPKYALQVSKELNNSTHVLAIEILNFKNIPDTDFEVVVKTAEPNWISESNLSSDLDIEGHNYQLLEKKTALFSVLSDALKDRYYNREQHLIEISFSKKNKK